MLLLFVPAPAEGPAFLGSFRSPPRDDAPIDAVLLLDAADIPVEATLQRPDGAWALRTEPHTASFTSQSVRVLPPEGGWPVGEPLTVTVAAGPGYPEASLSFQADGSSAASVPAPLIHGYAWELRSDAPYRGGCCRTAREVLFDVSLDTSDPWATLEVFETPADGDPGPSRIVDFQLGGGRRVLSALQWEEPDGSFEPACFWLASTGASGERSLPQQVCPSQPSSGCSHAPRRPSAWLRR